MKQLFAKTLCVAALVSAVSAAHAGIFNFNVLRTAGGTTGWNVQLQTTDWITWDVLSIKSLAGPNQATANAETINFSFFDGFPIATANQVYMDPSVPGSFGKTNVGPNPALGGPWVQDGSKFSTSDPNKQLRPSGPNSSTFTGKFTLDNTLQAKYLQMRIQGPVEQWNSQIIALTPEMPGGVLLLAALLPVGFIARKRFSA